MAPNRTCQQCGTHLPGHVADWLCPKCLLGQAANQASPDLPLNLHPPVHGSPAVLHYFGDYELLREIARGGMGVVYEARQVSLNRIVAVKLIQSGRFASEEYKKRFRAEAESAASLQHPNIVAIHEVGEYGGQEYFSMDFIEGSDLGSIVRERPLPIRRAATYLKTIAEAIHYAHQRGIMHRDLKPSNVLIDSSDQPRVTDFGLAKRLPSSELHSKGSELTRTGQVLGTPGFISPEQAGGKCKMVGAASDVYSLGAVFYFLVTARAPFTADSLEEILRQIHDDEPASLRLLNASVPRDLETICLKCLRKEPHQRYPSAQALAEDLGRWLQGEPIQARAAGRTEKLWRWCVRKPALAGAIAALHLVGATGLGGILWQWRRAEINADAAQQLADRESAQRQRAEAALTSLELQRVEHLFETDDVTMGMAYLARIVRQQPHNPIAVRRLVSALSQRSFALPFGLPLTHDSRVWHSEFSRDGRQVATAASDFTARLWDAATGQALGVPMLHSNAVAFAGFSPDGERLVTFSRNSRAAFKTDFSAHLWESPSGRAVGQPMTHSNEIRSVQFSPDALRVLTASEDGTARLWNARTGEALLEPLKHSGPVRSARFSPDGSQVVTASEADVHVWNASTGLRVAGPFRHRSGVTGAEFSPDGRRLVTIALDFSTCLWDVAKGLPIGGPLAHSGEVHIARFTSDGERIVVALRNGLVRIFSARDWIPLVPAMRHPLWVTVAGLGPDEERLFTASNDNTARLWSVDTGEPLTAPMQHDGLIWSGGLSPNGLFAVTASADKTARIWDVRLGDARSQTLFHQGPVNAAEFSPDGEWIATASQDGSARLWNARTGAPRGPEMRHASWVSTVKFSADGSRIATASGDGTARIWDGQTCQPLTEPLRHGSPVDRIAFSPEGLMLATAAHIGTNVLCLWDTRTGQLIRDPIRHAAGVSVLSFDPDGRRLVSDDFNADRGQIRDLESGRLLFELIGHEGWLCHGEFSPDGQRILTASEDGTARVWDASTGLPLAGPMRHRTIVPLAHFSADGRRIVTASQDMTSQVWDVMTALPVGDPMRHRDRVNSAAFSPDGRLVVTASDDGTARLWDASTGWPVSEPFHHRDKVVSARFSPDGLNVLTASHDGSARVWEVPPSFLGVELSPASSSLSDGKDGPNSDPMLESPAVLLADLAESIIGKRVHVSGSLESVSPTTLGVLRTRIATIPLESRFRRWLDWFLADRSARAISPNSQVTVPEYVKIRASQTNEASWREALMLSPTHGIAFSQMAQFYAEQSKDSASSATARAEWASRQAVKYAPWDSKAWHYRRLIAERRGNWTQLLADADRAIRVQRDNACAWTAKAQALEALEDFDGMLTASHRALESWQNDATIQWDLPLRRDILKRRGDAFRRLGRLAEAAADNAAYHGLPARESGAGPDLINLDSVYNGGDTEEFPGTIQRLAGTDFDFRGWVHLDVRRAIPQAPPLPVRIDGIPVQRKCRKLQFLHTASSASSISVLANHVREEHLNVPLGTAIGYYLIHYTDGQRTQFPIVHGRDVRDYWCFPEYAGADSTATVAWTGSSFHSRHNGATTRLFKSTWENPRPDVPIDALDFVHAGTYAAPILVAITAE